MKLFKNIYMELALKKAKKSMLYNEVPVGCVIVNNNTKKILAIESNKIISHNSSLDHAEMLAIKKACSKIKNNRLENCSIYITLEPCIMCYGAIINTKIPIIYFGAYSTNSIGIDNINIIKHNSNHSPKVYGGIYEEESKQMLKSFFIGKR